VLDDAIGRICRLSHDSAGDEVGARRVVESMAVAWTAVLLAQHGDQAVSDAYMRSRLGGDWGSEFGTLPTDAALSEIAHRAVPPVR